MELREEMKGKEVLDFTLKDQKEGSVTLSDLRGKRVLLSFHPLAWTKVCAQQMKDLEKRYEEFEGYRVVPLGLSVDSVPSKAAWAATLGVERLSMLADFWPTSRRNPGALPRGGLLREGQHPLDEKGRVLWAKVYDLGQLPTSTSSSTCSRPSEAWLPELGRIGPLS